MSRESPVRGRSARELVRRAAVLGAGTMGAQIAGHLANNGIPCLLFDLASDGAGSAGNAAGASPGGKPDRNRLANAARDRLLKLRPAPLYGPKSLDLITACNFEDDLPRLRDVDWVIEAVVEKLEPKRDLWTRVAPHLRSDSIASSNTSGIPIREIATALPEATRKRFLGTHFFNPPRYLRLLEIIPTADTDPQVVSQITRFAEHVLGKGVVIAHDVPNFIANRIGCYGLMVSLQAMEEFKLGPDEVDSVTGPAMGRPRSATFRTLDLVGLDVFVDVCANVSAHVSDEAERNAFTLPPYFLELVKRGWIGEKAGRGFYRRVEEGGKTEILALDPASLEYRPQKRIQAASLAAVRDLDEPAERLKTLVMADDLAGRFAWRVLSRLQAYAAGKVGEVAGDVASIDRAMRWGFGWDLGPFEAWDQLGVRPTVKRMEADRISVPLWVRSLADDDGSFYDHTAEGTTQWSPQVVRTTVPAPDRTISIERLRATAPRVVERPGATLFQMADGVGFLDFHSPKQAIGGDFVEMVYESVARVPESLRGLIVGSHVRPNFCVGANLFMVLLAAQEGDWEQVDLMVRRFQGAMLALKRAPFPVAVAPYGMALGGGAEIVLAGDRVAAAAESYVGLVEVGAGLVPAGGGCKEMLLRATAGVMEQLAQPAGQRRGMMAQLVPDADFSPVLAHVFETIALAKVSGSAQEARQLGFLRPSDAIVPNLDHVLYVAQHAVCEMDEQGYAPPGPAEVLVFGDGARAVLELAGQHMVWGGYASQHDLLIVKKLARVLTGGDRQAGTRATEEYFLDLEREAFLSLCGEPKSIARMQHVLQTGRPLRN